MKIFVDPETKDYIELKTDESSNVDLSVRTKFENKTIVITAKLNSDVLDKVIANLILLKSRVANEKK